MADRNPLYVSAGELKSFATGDTLAIANGGTGNTTGTVASASNALALSLAATSGVSNFILMSDSGSGFGCSVFTDSGLTYNASTNALMATTFIGALTGNALTATGLSAVLDPTKMTNLTGDVTSVGVATTIANDAVTYAKLQNVAASSLVGNMTTAAADATGVPLGTGLKFESSTLQALLPLVAQGRLTLESGVAVSSTDQASKTTIYYTPYNGNRLALYDATNWQFYQVPEFAAPLGTLTSGKNYDVWAFASTATPSSTNTTTDIVTFGSAPGWATGSIVRIATAVGGLTVGTDYYYNAASSTTGSFHATIAAAIAATPKVDLTANITNALTAVSLEFLVWTNDSTRATAILQQNGVWTKSGDATRRLLGTFRTTSTTVTQDTLTQRFVVSVDNPVIRRLHTCPAYSDDNLNTTYTTTSTSYTEANSGNSSKVEFICSIPGVYSRCFAGSMFTTPAASGAAIGIGVDSTTTATVAALNNSFGVTQNVSCETGVVQVAGYHYFDLLIKLNTGATAATFFADTTHAGGANDPKLTFLEAQVMG